MLFSLITIKAQSINGEFVEFNFSKSPEVDIPLEQRLYQVKVESPFTLTAEDVIANAQAEHQAKLDNFSNVEAESKAEYQKKLDEYDEKVALAKEKYALESKDFKELSLLERMALTEQGKKPKLVLPTKPEYYPPRKPVYKEPNLNDYLIIDNSILANELVLNGFKRKGNNVDIEVKFSDVSFQDNAGQSFINLPTQVTVHVNEKLDLDEVYFSEFEFVSNYPTNNINKEKEKKKYLYKVIEKLNTLLNEKYGFVTQKKKIYIQVVKNRKNTYDDLEKANIYVTTSLKKLKEDPTSPINAEAMKKMQKGVDIWVNALTKVDYNNKKAVYNEKIATYLYFNLIKLNLALGNKAEAEKYLNELQENQVKMKLSYDEENTLNKLEEEIYAN